MDDGPLFKAVFWLCMALGTVGGGVRFVEFFPIQSVGELIIALVVAYFIGIGGAFGLYAIIIMAVSIVLPRD